MLKKEDNGILAEFLFLIPNMMFYTAIGFLTALKDDDNYREMGKYLEQIASITENTTSELADVLIDNQEKQKILKELQSVNISKN